MAIYIQINKIEEFDDGVVYEFGPIDQIIGQVILYFDTGQVELFDILPSYQQTGKYPDKIYYVA